MADNNNNAIDEKQRNPDIERMQAEFLANVNAQRIAKNRAQDPTTQVPADASDFQAALAASGIKPEDVNSLIQRLTDPTTGDARASYADGMNPDNPINVSPVTLGDRLKLSAGNEKGKLAYLKTNYEDAMMNVNNDLVVKSGGQWHRVDPTGLGDVDPWTISGFLSQGKEILADTLDLAPEIATVAASIPAGVNPLALAGISALAATGRVTMGKLAGTYEAEPEEIVQEVALDTVLAFGAAKLLPGVKPTAKRLGQALAKASPALEKLGRGTKDLLTTAVSATTGISEDSVNLALSKGGVVGRRLSAMADAGKGQLDDILRIGKDRQVQNVLQQSKAANSAVRDMWKQGERELIRAVSDHAAVDFKAVTTSPLDDLIKAGIAITNKEGKIVLKNFDDISSAMLRGGNLEEEVLRGLSQIVDDPKAYQALQRVVQKANNKLMRGAKGKTGTKLMLDAFKEVRDALETEAERAFEKKLGAAGNYFSYVKGRARAGIDNTASGIVSNKEAWGNWRAISSAYGQAKNKGASLLKISRSADPALAAESFVNSLMTGAEKNSVKKGAGKTIAEITKSARLGRLVEDFSLTDAAMEFAPKIRKNFMQFGMVSAMVEGATMGGVPVLTPMAAAATSPRLALPALSGAGAAYRSGTKLSKQAAREFIKAAHKGMNAMAAMPEAQRLAFLQNEELTGAYIQSMLQALKQQ